MIGGADGAPVWLSTAGAVTYGQLRERLVGEGPRHLAFVVCEPGFESVVHYLTCLERGWPAVLVEPAQAAALAEIYRPGYWFGPGEPAALAAWREQPCALHPDLALLLTTSGSTGSPKLVRLSRANLLANARSIGEYLELTPAERPLLALPLNYSYGLSVVNSHLLAGAALVDPEATFLQAPFWERLRGCTSLAGVPFFYESLARLRVNLRDYPELRTVTQAGGPLGVRFQQALLETGKRVFVMYGQTEATARMAYVPPDRLGEKLGSIGVAIPGGRLALEDEELIYEGPNVMLGYASCREDLALGDVQGGRLATGDLGRCDDEGYFFLTGRKARFAKLFGKRVSLEDVEAWAEAQGVPAIALEREGRLELQVEGEIANPALWLGVPPSGVRVIRVERLARTAAGKKIRQ